MGLFSPAARLAAEKRAMESSLRQAGASKTMAARLVAQAYGRTTKLTAKDGNE